MRVLKIAGAAIAAVIVVIALLLMIGIPSGFLTSAIQDRVERETGYKLVVNGATRLGIWPSLNVTLNDITVQDPKARDLDSRLTIGSVQADIPLRSVLSGHPQIGELIDLACTFPDTQIVLDHCGGPAGTGQYAGRRDEIFATWKTSIREIAKCPNVVVKLGGLAMCLLGYDFHQRPMPPSSEELATAWRPYIETCIEAFGVDRAMFESNFPPDKG